MSQYVGKVRIILSSYDGVTALTPQDPPGLLTSMAQMRPLQRPTTPRPHRQSNRHSAHGQAQADL